MPPGDQRQGEGRKMVPLQQRQQQFRYRAETSVSAENKTNDVLFIGSANLGNFSRHSLDNDTTRACGTMVEPRPIGVGNNVETLATEIIDRVTLGAMNIVDASGDGAAESGSCLPSTNSAAESGRGKCYSLGKNRNRSLRSARRSDERLKKKARREEQDNCRLNHEEKPQDDVDRRASEEIRKIVEGLRGIRIGDSALVKPATQVPCLEREVKRAIAEMGSDTGSGIPEMKPPVTEGHGDVDAQNYREAVATWVADEETPYAEQRESEPEKRSGENEVRLSRQTAHRVQPDMSKLRSTCFLHRIIRELEDAESSRENILSAGPSASISAISQERIAAWEESEERFIRTIEEGSRDGSEKDDEGETNDDSSINLYPCAIEPFNNNAPIGRVIDVEIVELGTIPAPLEPPILSSTYPALACESSSATLERSTSGKKKSSVRAKLRKFFLSAFKRGKH